MEAAFELFTRNGFHETTIDDVVNAVEVSRRTFFRYFKSKDDVLLAWFDNCDDTMRKALEAQPPHEKPFNAMRRAMTDAIGQYEADRERMIALDRLIMSTPAVRARKQEMHAQWAEKLAEVLAKRLGVDVETDMRPRLIANVSFLILTTMVEAWRAGGGRESLAKLVDEGFRFLKEGHI